MTRLVGARSPCCRCLIRTHRPFVALHRRHLPEHHPPCDDVPWVPMTATVTMNSRHGPADSWPHGFAVDLAEPPYCRGWLPGTGVRWTRDLADPQVPLSAPWLRPAGPPVWVRFGPLRSVTAAVLSGLPSPTSQQRPLVQAAHHRAHGGGETGMVRTSVPTGT